MMPTSAMSLSSSIISFSSPGTPFSASRGAWLVGEAKWEFPSPPFPPAAATACWPGFARSAIRTALSVLVHALNQSSHRYGKDKGSAVSCRADCYACLLPHFRPCKVCRYEKMPVS
jgi:hypothetical protein